jgi:predicted nucleic acid-binding protein
MNLTKDRFFIDTNIIVYTFNHKEESKRNKSTMILSHGLASGNGVISFQIIQEFCNVALKKFETPLSVDDCKKFINNFLYPLCDVYPGFGLYNTALEMYEATGYAFYDCLMISSAILSGCRVLYSEDMHHSHKIKDIQIINPFIVDNCVS